MNGGTAELPILLRLWSGACFGAHVLRMGGSPKSAAVLWGLQFELMSVF